MEENKIKSITNHTCPNCNQDIFVETQIIPPTIMSIFTPKDVATSKVDCITRIETLTIDEEKKTSVIKWINDPRTVFGPSEVDSIINSLLKPEE